MTLPELEVLSTDTYNGSTVNPGFGTWTTVDSERCSLLIGEVGLDAGLDNAAIVDVEVDESGGSTADYSFRLRTTSTLSPDRSFMIFLNPGATYRIVNTQDPVGNNSINKVKEAIL